MKIAVLGTRGFPNVQGGIEKHCEELYPRLAALGCEVVVLGRVPYLGPTPFQHQGVLLWPIACPKNKFFETIVHTFLGIFKAKELKCDILHIHAIGPSLFVPLARWLGLKVVVTHHGHDYERKKWNAFAKTILRIGEGCASFFAHRLIVISKPIAQAIQSKYKRDVNIIPNGVVVKEKFEDQNVLKKFDLKPGRYILTVGRFVPEKGFDHLIESFAQWSVSRLQKQEVSYKLVIVGDADHEDDFSRRLKQRSAEVNNVVLTGFQSASVLQTLYSQAALFVLPSFHEGLPIVLLEALSWGLSCLVSDIPAHRELNLEENRYIKPGDIQQLIRRLDVILNQSD